MDAEGQRGFVLTLAVFGLGETFYSQVPFLFGEYVAKFSIAPVFDLTMLTGASIGDSPDLATSCRTGLRGSCANVTTLG